VRNNLLKNWNWTRVIYLSVGIVILVHTIIDNQLIGILGGAYISLMGVFGFGCAKGNCVIGQNKN
jgi:hypothetical protein